MVLICRPTKIRQAQNLSPWLKLISVQYRIPRFKSDRITEETQYTMKPSSRRAQPTCKKEASKAGEGFSSAPCSSNKTTRDHQPTIAYLVMERLKEVDAVCRGRCITRHKKMLSDDERDDIYGRIRDFQWLKPVQRNIFVSLERSRTLQSVQAYCVLMLARGIAKSCLSLKCRIHLA